MTSGRRYKIRMEGDVLYAEPVLSAAEKENGNFQSFELRKFKDRYTGYEHEVIAQRCAFDYTAEFSVLTASRIEGQVKAPPLGTKILFNNCLWDTDFYEWTLSCGFPSNDPALSRVFQPQDRQTPGRFAQIAPPAIGQVAAAVTLL